jgi:hypothetical protein
MLAPYDLPEKKRVHFISFITTNVVTISIVIYITECVNNKLKFNAPAKFSANSSILNLTLEAAGAFHKIAPTLGRADAVDL